MSLLKLKAKVLLTSEDEMEAEERYDLGNIAKSKEWVWRNVAVPLDEVYKIIEYDKTRSIVQMRDDEKILVKESFESLFDRWDSLKIMEFEPSEQTEEDLDLSPNIEDEDECDDDDGDILK